MELKVETVSVDTANGCSKTDLDWVYVDSEKNSIVLVSNDEAVRISLPHLK